MKKSERSYLEDRLLSTDRSRADSGGEQVPRPDSWWEAAALPEAVARLRGTMVQIRGGRSRFLGRLAVEIGEKGKLVIGDTPLPDRRRRRLWRIYRAIFRLLHWRTERRRRRAPQTAIFVPVPSIYAHARFLDREREWALRLQAHGLLQVVEPPSAYGQPATISYIDADGALQQYRVRFPTFKALSESMKRSTIRVPRR